MSNPDPVLQQFRDALADVYGDRIERIVLFGSRARGDARPDSDDDIAIFLKDLSNHWQEIRRIVDIEQSIRDDTSADIHTMPFPAGSWRDTASPLMYEVHRDGRDL